MSPNPIKNQKAVATTLIALHLYKSFISTHGTSCIKEGSALFNDLDPMTVQEVDDLSAHLKARLK